MFTSRHFGYPDATSFGRLAKKLSTKAGCCGAAPLWCGSRHHDEKSRRLADAGREADRSARRCLTNHVHAGRYGRRLNPTCQLTTAKILTMFHPATGQVQLHPVTRSTNAIL